MTVVLQSQKLRPGDIVLSSRAKEFGSWFIRFATDSPVSHASLHLGSGILLESVRTEGVRRSHSRRFVYPTSDTVKVLRPRDADAGRIEVAINTAKALTYRPYSMLKAAVSLFPIDIEREGRFCSEVVAEAFIKAELDLPGCDDARHTTPADLLDCASLEDVTSASIRKLETEDIEAAINSFNSRHTLAFQERKFRTTQRDVESRCWNVARPVLRSGAFPRPHSLWHLLRLMADHHSEYLSAVAQLDASMYEELERAGAEHGYVEPHQIIPHLTACAISVDRVLSFWDGGDNASESFEFVMLARDLVASKTADLAERAGMTSEFREAANESGLNAIRAFQMLSVWDEYFAKNNYTLLEGIAEGFVSHM